MKAAGAARAAIHPSSAATVGANVAAVGGSSIANCRRKNMTSIFALTFVSTRLLHCGLN